MATMTFRPHYQLTRRNNNNLIGGDDATDPCLVIPYYGTGTSDSELMLKYGNGIENYLP